MADPDDTGKLSFQTSADPNDQIIERVEETARITKNPVDLGGVRLETVTRHHDEILSATLRGDRVEIRRVPRGEVVETPPSVREENGVTIIPVLEERAVLHTELVLVEEVHLIRTETEETVEVPVTLRRQEVVETRLEPEAGDTPLPNAEPVKEEDR